MTAWVDEGVSVAVGATGVIGRGVRTGDRAGSGKGRFGGANGGRFVEMARILWVCLAVVVGVFDVSAGRAESGVGGPGHDGVVCVDPGVPAARPSHGSRAMAGIRGFGVGVRSRFATVEWLEKRGLMSASAVSAPLPETSASDTAVAATAAAPARANASVTQAPVSYNFDPKWGLSKLTYNGITYIDGTKDAGKIQPWLALDLADLNGGNKTSVWPQIRSSTFDAATKTLTQVFDGIKVVTKYTERADGIALNVTITNTGVGRKVTGYNLLPFQSALPESSFSATTEGWWVNGVDGTLTSRLDYQNNATYLTNDSPGSERTVGYVMFAAYQPTQGHRLRIGTANIWGTGLGFSGRQWLNLAPGASDSFALSIRFAPSSTPTTTALADKVQQTQQANPYVLNWSDRRLIGQAFPFSGGQPLFHTPTQPSQAPAFEAAVWKYVRDHVAAAKRENVQGVIFWDLEGPAQFSQGYAYAGDPRLIPDTNPYFDKVADQFFKAFTDQGVRVGLTIRPGKLVKQADGTYLRTTPADQVAEYRSIINYARTRWGCTLFYVDSVDTMHPEDLKQIARENPDILLIPEVPFGGGTGYSAFSAPYRETAHGFTQTPADVLSTYPEAFSVVKPNTSDPKLPAAIVEGVRRGDIYIGFLGQMDALAKIVNGSGLPLTRTTVTAGAGAATAKTSQATPGGTSGGGKTVPAPPTTTAPSTQKTGALPGSGTGPASQGPLQVRPRIFHVPTVRSASAGPSVGIAGPRTKSASAVGTASNAVAAPSLFPSYSALTAASFSNTAVFLDGKTTQDERRAA